MGALRSGLDPFSQRKHIFIHITFGGLFRSCLNTSAFQAKLWFKNQGYWAVPFNIGPPPQSRSLELFTGKVSFSPGIPQG